MKYFKYKFLWMTLFALCVVAPDVFAITVKVVDQYGEPVKNAVVSAFSSEPINTDGVEVMDQINRQFSPHVLILNKGQKVKFPNSDNIRHHIYSFSKPKAFEIKMFKGGESSTLDFNKPGIVVLGCNIHDNMIGYIYVGENEVAVVTDSSGLADIDNDADYLHVWHSRYSTDSSARKKVTIKKGDALQALELFLLPVKKEIKKRKFGSKKYGKKER